MCCKSGVLVLLPIFAILLCIVAIAAPVAAADDANDQCNEPTGIVEDTTYTSDLLGKQMVYSIYMPPCYDSSGVDYPVLYLMHGSDSDNKLWLDLGVAEALDEGIRNGDYPPIVVVMPNGDKIANVNTFVGASWANIFVSELMPSVESNYHVSTQAGKRAIGGISRGGFWAYQIALTHPDLFSIVGGHSAVFTPVNAGPKYNPITLVVTAKEIDDIRFWLDRAVQDYSGPTMNTVAIYMHNRGLDLEYKVYKKGNHTNEYWSSHVRDYLEFYTATWH